MIWSEAGYPSEQTDNPQNKVEGQSDKVYNTTDFLSKFEGSQNSIVDACLKEIQSNIQLKEGFDNLLKSGISNDLINKIKQELEYGTQIGIDEATLKDSVQGIIAENIGTFKVGSVAFEGTLNQMNQDKETAAQKGVDTVQAEETAAQKGVDTVQAEETAAQDKETEENMVQKVKEAENMCLDYRTQLLAGHDDVRERTEKKTEIAKQQISEETRNKLKEKGYDDDTINNYILLRVTANEVKNDSSFDRNAVAQFESKVNELSKLDVILKSIDNACNIPDTSLNSFSSENLTKTRTELFDKDIGNESLIQARKNNIESHAEAYAEIFLEMGTDEVIAKYGKFLEGDLKEFWQQYESNRDVIKNKIAEIGIMIKNQQIFGENGKNDISDEEKLLFDNYKKMISVTSEIRKETEEQTKNLMEEMCIISQIKGMYMCMGEGDDFNLNKANEIRYDEQGAMILDGHVDGVAFSIRQDINNPEAKLQTSQKLARSADGNVFSIGGTDNFVDSNFILPSQNKIFESIVATVQSDKSLENYDNQDEYLENLQKNIIGTMEKIYKDTEYVHHYMKNQVKGEKVVDNTLGLIAKIDSDVTNNVDLLKSINETNHYHKDLYGFLKILNFNIKNSTDYEKDKLNWCIDEIGRIIDNYQNNKKSSGLYPQEVSEYLENDTWVNGSQKDRLLLVFSMFNHFHEKPSDREGVDDDGSQVKMIINDLYVQLHDKPKETKEQQERDEKSNEEHDTAEKVLNLGDTNLWPPEPTVNMA